MSHQQQPRSPGQPTKSLRRPQVPTQPKKGEVLPVPSVAKPVKSKPAKAPKYVTPEGVPIPTMGFPAFNYWCIKNIRRRPDLVPELSPAEKAKHYRGLRQAKQEATIATLRQLSDEVPTATVAFINTKGAAATTATTVYGASEFAEDTRTVSIVLDANPASGTSAARLGKDYTDTLSIQELANSLDSDTTAVERFQNFIRGIRPTRYSVRAITATSIVNGQNRVPEDKIKRILEVTKRQCEYLFIDTANDITEPVTLAVVAAADVLVFTANVAVHDSLRQLATTMETLRQHGHADKVNDGVVVISNLPVGADLSNYRKFLDRVNLKDEVQQTYPFDGPFLAIPHDPEISRDGEVDLEALRWETREAYRQLGIALLEQAYQASYNRPISVINPADALQPKESFS